MGIEITGPVTVNWGFTIVYFGGILLAFWLRNKILRP